MTATNPASTLRTPVFVDAHVHLAHTGLSLAGLDLRAVRHRAALLGSLEAYARRSSDAVILGSGWDESGWSSAELPTLEEIDRAAPGRVVLLSRVDGHSALVSGPLVYRARNRGILDAPGWDGTGRVERAASRIASQTADALVTRAQRRAAIARALEAAGAAGIGCLHEMAAPHTAAGEDLELIRELTAGGDTPAVVTYWGELAADGGVERAVAYGCAGAAGDLSIDGAFGSRTAALRQAYADAPERTGALYIEPDAVAEHVIACTRAGLQAGFHCIGDAATASAGEGFRRAARVVGVDALRSARHRLEHVELIEPRDLATLLECGVVVSAQPAFDAFWGGEAGMYAGRLGRARALAANPLAGMLELGLPLAFGSDSPVTPFDPWGGVRAAVWHHEPASRIELRAAFLAHTEGGWFAAKREAPARSYAEWHVPAGVEDGLPRLEPGAPLPRCLRTVVAGRTVFESRLETQQEKVT